MPTITPEYLREVAPYGADCETVMAAADEMEHINEVACRLVDRLSEEVTEARAEIKRLRADRDLWHARAFAMFWKLPKDLKVGDLQRDAERALAFVRADSGSAKK